MPESTQSASDLFRLDGRVAVVTGASRGIGAAIAAGLVGAGARVFGLSRSASAPDGVEALACDLSDPAAIGAAFEAIGAREQRLDILVNAAGISLAPSNGGADAELQRFRKTLEIDLLAAYACILKARPLMSKSSHGAIINVTSINSRQGFPNNAGYVAAKAGLAGLTRAMAVDLATDAIRVNALAPGYVHTAMTEASHSDPALNEQRRNHTILGRWGEPTDMVGAAVFLASDASAYMTGQEIVVDGGWCAKGLTT